MCGFALAGPAAAFAQSARVSTIGYLSLASIREPPSRERQAFLDGLRDLGYVDGQTIRIVYASAENEPEFIDAACADLIAKKVDVIVAAGAVAVAAAQRATRTTPVIVLALGDPTGVGAVHSLSRSGSNVTGVSFMSSDLAGKRMQLMKELLPRATRVGVLWNANNPNSRAEARAALAAARSLGLAVLELPVGTSMQLEAALGSLENRKLDALYVSFGAGLIADHRSTIVESALRQRVPVVSGWSFLTEAGGLLSYAPDIPATFRRGAYYVDRVLTGTPPGSLPIEQPTKVDLVLNAKTARALGIAIPPSLELRADEVIR